MEDDHPLKTTLRVVNDVIHDVAAGAWPGAALTLWMVRRGAAVALAPEQLDTLVRSWTWILTFMLVAFAVQAATGLARLEHRKSPPREAIAKHAVFVLLFAFAAWQAFASLQL